MSKTINAAVFRSLLISGANRLIEHKQEVDELNVFPVPDGDTGTNMSLTVSSAVEAVRDLPENSSVEQIMKALSNGALRGARGNSGVILSQIIRGCYKGLKGAESVGTENCAEALMRGVESAYKAVMRPKEGTILTVADGFAKAFRDAAEKSEDLQEVLAEAIAEGEKVLARTPDMLPVLKEAGVVDAGGMGLMWLYKGIADGLADGAEACSELSGFEKTEAPDVRHTAQAVFSTESITFGYCTEFIVHCEKAESHEDELRTFLSSIGDSLVVVADEDIIKIHVHTNHPGQAIEKGLGLGYLTNLKIDNMRLQHQSLVFSAREAGTEAAAAYEHLPLKKEAAVEETAEEERKPYGFVAVASGDGIVELFRNMLVDEVITGGQTMNPSTQDILSACERVPADTIFVLPNNKNIILAAQQAGKMLHGKKLMVVPTRNVPQGFAALAVFDETQPAATNLAAMEEAIGEVHTAVTTYAVRSTKLNDMKIRKNDILGMLDGELTVAGSKLPGVAKQLLDRLLTLDKDIYSIYYGEDATEEQAKILASYIEAHDPDSEVGVYYGGQPVYHFYISAE